MVEQKHTHREYLEACLSGHTLNRPPISLWRHFPVDDQTPGGLAEATVQFQNRYDFDFVKVTPSSSFCLYDWGSRDEWHGSTEGTREYTSFPIQRPEDWLKLKVLDPRRGWLGGQLECLRMITQRLGSQVPVIQTIFNPLAQAKNLVGNDALIVHLRRYPEAVHAGLQTITKTSQDFIEAALQTGISGIFYAVQHAQYRLMTPEEYRMHGCAYDLQVLEPAGGCWFNLLHLHGDEVMFDLFLDYPVSAINWHDQETTPGLGDAQQRFKGVVCGGLRQWQTLVMGTPENVKREATIAFESTGGKRFILGTGCVTPIIAPEGNLMMARNSFD